MKKNAYILPVMLLILGMLAFGCQSNKTPETYGWKLAYQSYTFKNFTFEEGLQKANELGLKFVEAYPGQRISADNPNPTNYTSGQEDREEIKSLLNKYGIRLVNYGVVKAKSEEEWKQVFDFSKEMGIETITAEIKPEHFDFIEQLCDDYKINVAIHNHPKPSLYWEPDSVLKYVDGRSQRIGACADVGHWVRSGLNPVECLNKLKGRIISIHFKDLNEMDRKAHDVPWGTGISDVPAMLQELKDQKFKGIFSIEYEHNWDNSVPEIAQSIEYFEKITAELK